MRNVLVVSAVASDKRGPGFYDIKMEVTKKIISSGIRWSGTKQRTCLLQVILCQQTKIEIKIIAQGNNRLQ